MADHGDFTAYAVARWPALVRTLVLLGHAPTEADAVAREGLARCVRGWAEASRGGDLDSWAYRVVLGAAGARHLPEVAPDPGVVDPTILDLDERRRRLDELVVEVSAMPPGRREAIVLRHVADLDPGQVADVLGTDLGTVDAAERTGPPAEEFRDVVGAIPVRPPPVTEVLGMARARRRRRTAWIAGGLASALAVAGVATWLGTRPPPPLPDTRVTVTQNPAEVAWFASGTLHLRAVAVDLPQLDTIVTVPDGVVYADGEGRIVLVDHAGVLHGLGWTTPGLRLASDAESGWVAWQDAERDELVLYDTVSGDEVDRLGAIDDAEPVAIDQERVYFNDPDGAWAWELDEEQPDPVSSDRLLDVASAVRVSEFSEASIRIAQPLFDIEVSVPGSGAMLSPDGRYVLTRVDFGEPDEVRIYEAASGDQVDTGLGPQHRALAATFGSDDTVTYVVVLRDHAPGSGEFVRQSESGPQLLRTCDLDLGLCRTDTQVPNDVGRPVLPD